MTIRVRVKPAWPIILAGIGGIVVAYANGRATISFDYANSQAGVDLRQAVVDATTQATASATSATASATSATASHDAQLASEAARDISIANAATTLQYDYETRAIVVSVTVPALRHRIVIGRYDTAKPWCPAPYIRGTSAGPAAFQDASGAWWEIDLSSKRANVFWFGAKGDFIQDDAPMFQAASEAIYATGKPGTVTDGGAAGFTYRFASHVPSGGGAVWTRPDVSWDIGGTVKAGNGFNAAQVAAGNIFGYFLWHPPTFTAEYAPHRVKFNVACIDGNAANNGGGGIFDGGGNLIGSHFFNYFFYAQAGDDIEVRARCIGSPGTNCIILSSNDLTIKRAKLINCSASNCGPDANAESTDHSTFYISGTDCHVENIRGDQLFRIQKPCALVELHGNGHTWANIRSRGYYRGLIIAADAADMIDCTGAILGAEECYQALTAFTGDHAMDGISIDQITASHYQASIGALVDFGFFISGVGKRGSVRLTNLKLSGLEADVSGGHAHAGSIMPGVVTGPFERFYVSGDLNGLAGPGVIVGSVAANSDIELDVNISDCGRTANATYQKGIMANTVGPYQRLKINGSIRNVLSGYMTHGLQIIASAGGPAVADIASNIFFQGIATHLDISGIPLGWITAPAVIPPVNVEVKNTTGGTVMVFHPGAAGTKIRDPLGNLVGTGSDGFSIVQAEYKISFGTTAPGSWWWQTLR